MADDRLPIDEATVRQLIAGQFPQLAHLPLRKVKSSGWDNRTFRLGEELSVRLPSAPRYAPQIGRETVALSRLAGLLAVPIPARVHQGKPGDTYPCDWAINRWLAGAPAGRVCMADDFIVQCGRFLALLHGIPPSGELPAGPDNFHRGGPLARYASEVEAAFAQLEDHRLLRALSARWSRALASLHQRPPCWVHGDFFPWNLLANPTGNLCGVIDWGLVATGDPACDYAMAWTCFDARQRQVLREASGVDRQTWSRARGWSLWKAVTLATGINTGTPEDVAGSEAVLERIAADGD